MWGALCLQVGPGRQAASRRLPSGIALSVADYEGMPLASARLDDPWPYAFSTLCASIAEGRCSQVPKDFTAIKGREPESFETSSSIVRPE
jgi:hypothetical protein